MARFTKDVTNVIERHLDYKDFRTRIGDYYIMDGHELHFKVDGIRYMLNYNQNLKFINIVMPGLKNEQLLQHDMFKKDAKARIKLNEQWMHQMWPEDYRYLLNTGKHGGRHTNSNKLYFRVYCTDQAAYWLFRITTHMVSKILENTTPSMRSGHTEPLF